MGRALVPSWPHRHQTPGRDLSCTARADFADLSQDLLLPAWPRLDSNPSSAEPATKKPESASRNAATLSQPGWASHWTAPADSTVWRMGLFCGRCRRRSSLGAVGR